MAMSETARYRASICTIYPLSLPRRQTGLKDRMLLEFRVLFQSLFFWLYKFEKQI